MKAVVILASILALASCATPATEPELPKEAAPVAPRAPTPEDTASNLAVQPADGALRLQPLTGSGLRFDGVYDHQASATLHYFMRFFPRGNVALVAGGQRADDPVRLSDQLTVNAQSGVNNIHNVPVTWRGDSILFSTMASRGAITYAGTVLPGDTLRFLKVSRINGKQAIVKYAFRPDSPLK